MIAAIADLASADYILTDNEADFQHYSGEIRPKILSLRNLPQPEQSDLLVSLGLQDLLKKLEDN